jgi:D-threo-aldose 1-dehydrogenase
MVVDGGGTVGRAGLRLPALGLGTGSIGGLYRAVPETQAAATVACALALGIRYFDTAPYYGLGVAERRLGRALRDVPSDSVIVSTKVGRLLRPLIPGEARGDYGFVNTPSVKPIWDFTAAGIRRSLEESLARLGRDAVDMVLLHDPDSHEREIYRTGFPALAELRASGVVKAIGVGMNQAAMPARLVRDLDLDVVLLAGRYTLLDHTGLDELLPACARRGVAVVIGGVYNSGLLADPAPGAHYDYASASTTLVARANALAGICERYGVPLKAAAIQFPFGHRSVVSVLTGARSADEVRENVTMLETPVPSDLWATLRDAGLLPANAPLPA